MAIPKIIYKRKKFQKEVKEGRSKRKAGNAAVIKSYPFKNKLEECKLRRNSAYKKKYQINSKREKVKHRRKLKEKGIKRT